MYFPLPALLLLLCPPSLLTASRLMSLQLMRSLRPGLDVLLVLVVSAPAAMEPAGMKDWRGNECNNGKGSAEAETGRLG
jgi:hypothetical protein